MSTVSSEKLGNSSGVNPAEVRRDFTYFGTFGKKGVGYEVDILIQHIQRILGADEPHKIALVGAGNLGSAIVQYQGLPRHGFHISAVFDTNPKKIGTHLGHLEVFDAANLTQIVRAAKIDIGIIAVPSYAAQSVADMLVSGGISVILNYTPALLRLPKGIQLHNSDPVQQLLHTLYYLSNNEKGLAAKGKTLVLT